MKKIFVIPLMIVLVVGLVFSGCAAPAPAPAPAAPGPGPTPSPVPGPTPEALAPTPEAPAPTLPGEIAINSGPKGTQFVQAASVAAVVEKYTPMKGFAEPTKTHVAAMPLMQEGRLDFIFVSQAEMALANRGAEYYEEVGPTAMRVAAAGCEIMFGFFTSPKTGIKTIPDMADKKVMWETKSAGVFYWIAQWVLDYYDLRDKIVSIPSPSPADRANELKMGKIDAYACSTQFQAMEIIYSSCGMVMLDIPKEVAEWVHSKYPPAFPAIVPKGYNGGMITKDVPTIAASTALQVRADLSDITVYVVLEAIFDHLEEFQTAHPDLEKMTLDRAVELYSIVPYHPGAIKFFKDRGVWTTEADKMQQRLLKELEGITYK